MKYAIVEHSGKQYRAEEGGRIEVDRLSLDVGKPVEFKEVLLVTDGKQTEIGSPYVAGAIVKGKVLEHAKARKITVFKYKPKQRYRRTQGHRQRLTRISIENVALPSAKSSAATKADESGTASKSTAKPKPETAGKKAAAKTGKRAAASGKKTTGKAKSGAKQSSGSKKAAGTKDKK